VWFAASCSCFESSEEVLELGLESRIDTLSSLSIWTTGGGLFCRGWTADSFCSERSQKKA